MNINEFLNLDPMKYYNPVEPAEGTAAFTKRQNMIENKQGEYVASIKNDGDWSMMIHVSKDVNIIRSRSISKVTGAYGLYTDKLPQICEEMNLLPDNTVLLGEVCWHKPHTNANTVGTILRCLAAKAVERQKENKLFDVVFDMLMLGNEDMCDMPYEARISIINNLFRTYQGFHYITPTEFRNIPDYQSWADEIIDNGGEGLVIQDKTNSYMPGTRTAWKTLKLKQHTPEMELKVLESIEPNKLYDGDDKEHWAYWYQDMPNANKQEDNVQVTKPYFMGWKNGVIVDYNGVPVRVTSGMSDDDRAWLATAEAQEAIKRGDVIATVKAMSENDLKSLRHPVLVRLRYLDK